MVSRPLAAERVPLVARSSVWIITSFPQPENRAPGKVLGQGVSGSLLADLIRSGPPPCRAVILIGCPRHPETGLTKKQTVNCRFASSLSVPEPNNLMPMSLSD